MADNCDHGAAGHGPAGRLLDIYTTARYRVLFPRGWVELAPGRTARMLEIRLPRVRWFTFITAWNPGSRLLPPRLNRQRQQTLRRAIRATGAAMLPAEGASPSRDWVEPSLLALGLDDAHAERLARRFGQNAVLHWRRGEPVQLRIP